MAKAKKKETLTPEERLQAVLVPDCEQPYKVPENWCWIHLLDSFENCTDSKKKIPQKEYLQDGKIAVVDQGQNLIGGYTNDREMIFAGNVPVIIFGDHTRCIKYIDFPFAQGADGIKVLKPKQFFNEKAFYYAFQTVDIPNMGYRRHFPLFDKYAIPVPPLSEQQRIVDRIESLFTKLDEAKQKAQDALNSFETRKAAILHKAFTGELTAQWRKEHGVRIESWKNVSVSEICHSLKYGTSKKSVSQGKVVVIRMGNLQDGEIRWDDLAYSNDEEDIEKYRLFSGDVLFNRTNSSALVGKTSIYRGDYPAIYAGYLIKLDYDHSRIIGNFLNYSLNTIRAKKYYNLVKTDGVNQSNINAKKIGAYKFAMPNIKEQIEIVRILDDMFAKEQQVKQVAETVVEQIDLIKKSILSRAFRGELGTNNQNEESAVELVKEVVEKSVEINNKPKTKRTVIPVEIKSALSSSNEEEIIRLLIKSAPKAVSVQMIMSISKKKFELMDALRSLEQKQEKGITFYCNFKNKTIYKKLDNCYIQISTKNPPIEETVSLTKDISDKKLKKYVAEKINEADSVEKAKEIVCKLNSKYKFDYLHEHFELRKKDVIYKTNYCKYHVCKVDDPDIENKCKAKLKRNFAAAEKVAFLNEKHHCGVEYSRFDIQNTRCDTDKKYIVYINFLGNQYPAICEADDPDLVEKCESNSGFLKEKELGYVI